MTKPQHIVCTKDDFTHADPPRPEIVCLCGSSRFVAEMAIIAWNLEKEGAIVLSLHLLPSWYPGVERDHQAEVEGLAEQMDELHLRKIDLSDRVIVCNIKGYIGDSTRREIKYAEDHGKPVAFIEERPQVNRIPDRRCPECVELLGDAEGDRAQSANDYLEHGGHFEACSKAKPCPGGEWITTAEDKLCGLCGLSKEVHN